MKWHLFLDIDGVLNNCGCSYWHKEHMNAFRINESPAIVLSKILLLADFKVVISSGWRGFIKQHGIASFKWMLLTHGIKVNELDHTYYEEKYSAEDRTKQIVEYINRNKVEKYIVIDDIHLPDLSSRQICPESNVGLRQRHIERAKKLLV